jgi:outer membrane receptor protein involved in Fe transport
MKTSALLLAFLVTIAALHGSATAGTTGKISGRITDPGGGEPVVGANVTVTGTTLGASTDIEGRYVIINVPPGTWELRISAVGYTATTVRQVRVNVDQTTIIDGALEASAVQMADIVVQAERPMVQKDRTATISVVTSEQIDLMPVKDFREVLAMQAGVAGEGSSLNVRGGRDNEVAYLIDGMYVKDPVQGALGTRVNNDAIQELVFLSGTFNAEYGNALSGVVNIVTKEGGSEFTGKLEAVTSEFGVGPYDDMHENRVSGILSGPMGIDGVSFFLSGERDARGSWLPWGYDKILAGIGKVSARVSPEFKLVLSGRYSENQRQLYYHEWKYIPDQSSREREYSRQATGSFTHSVMPNLFYDVRLSFFNRSYYVGIDKDTSQYISTGQRQYLKTAGNGFEFWALADPLGVTQNNSETWNLRTDVVWQIDKSNEVKAGFELKKHYLDYLDIFDPKRNYPYITDFERDPLEGAVYIQDKIELRALVVNLGLRFDYANQLATFRTDPLDPSTVVETSPKTQVSPRLGVAHPISERTTLHFSYGRFFQNPDYNRLYENSQYDLNVREPLFGSPDLDAERTTSYEVGISHQFGPTIAGTFTAYYKDVTGNVGTQFYPAFFDGRPVGYTLYVNEAYSNIRGFEVNLTMRRTGYVAGSLNYTYSVAKGSASSETEDYPGTTESTLLYPLSFDRPHALNVNLSLSYRANEGPEMFGARPFENMDFLAVFRAASGYPYTPTARELGYVQKNSARRPPTWSLDLEFSKDWEIDPIRFGVLLEILNVTDHANVRRVYTDTGEPDQTLESGNSEEYIKDPSNYGPPRRIRLGFRVRF